MADQSQTRAQGDEFKDLLETVTAHVRNRHETLSSLPTVPTPQAIAHTISSLPTFLPDSGLGASSTTSYLLDTILPGCLQAQSGPRYFGFVTGGVTPAAQLADILAGSYDENVQVTLPAATAATAVEARTLDLVLDLIGLSRDTFLGRTITTGATASNVLGLACARDHLYSVSPHLPKGYSYAQDGPPSAPNLPSPPIIILALHPHFSVTKAAALVGLGGGPRIVQTVPAGEDDELAFDLSALRARLEAERKVGRGVIVAYGLGEVNTGGFGQRLDEVAGLCKEYGAWLHVDAAFGGFAAVVPALRHLTRGMEDADSLTLDGHKWLNVPYDCGLFYTRHSSALTSVFAPPTAGAPAYLASSAQSSGQSAVNNEGQVIHDAVPSPLYVNIENSRRFRALPLFASLLSLGKNGYIDIVQRNISFARKVAAYIHDSEHYDLINISPAYEADGKIPIVPLNIVLFSGSASSNYPPSADSASVRLTAAINSTRQMYVTGTKWRGIGAIRLAVSNWRTGLEGEQDLDIVKGVLEGIAKAK